MKATNFRFRLTKIERGKRGTDEVLWLHALYDFVDGTLRDRPARLEVQYTLSNKPELHSVSLDMCYLIPTQKTRIYFKDNKPIKMEIWNPYPSMTEPGDSSKEISEDYLKRNLDYRAMVELIQDGEPIKHVLDDLVK